MIVRILGEGQFDVDDSSLDRLNELDAVVESAVETGDQEKFETALQALLDEVRAHATAHDSEALDASDLILPPADASLEDVRAMLAEDGLIPG